jgi:hypothetical protein
MDTKYPHKVSSWIHSIQKKQRILCEVSQTDAAYDEPSGSELRAELLPSTCLGPELVEGSRVVNRPIYVSSGVGALSDKIVV